MLCTVNEEPKGVRVKLRPGAPKEQLQSLSDSLSGHEQKTILDLDLSSCGLDDAALGEIVQMLVGMAMPVENLKVYRNKLTDVAAGHIAELLAVSPVPCKELHLSHNKIGEAGLTELLSAVVTNEVYPEKNGAGKAIPVWLRIEQNEVRNLDKVMEALMPVVEENRPQFAEGGGQPVVACDGMRVRTGDARGPLVSMNTMNDSKGKGKADGKGKGKGMMAMAPAMDYGGKGKGKGNQAPLALAGPPMGHGRIPQQRPAVQRSAPYGRPVATPNYASRPTDAALSKALLQTDQEVSRLEAQLADARGRMDELVHEANTRGLTFEDVGMLGGGGMHGF